MAFVAMWQSVFAYDFSAVAPSGQTLYYNIGGGEVTVTYPGSSSSYWNGYSKPTGNLTIPDSATYGGTTYAVTSIGNVAFRGCSGLTSVTIPNSVTSIGDYAFLDCSGLTSVTIPNSVSSIGDYAFLDCSGLSSVTISNSVTSIGVCVFARCSGLMSVTIPNSVSSIGDDAFSDCSGLTSVTMPNSVTYIGDGVFFGCTGLTSVTIPNSVTSIGDYVFYGCSGLTSVTIPNSVTDIGSYAFSGCSGLTSVTIPNSVTSIGNYVFHGCSGLTSVTIPNSVTSIGNYVFHGCTGLTSVTIPNSVTDIGAYAFSGCSGLTSVTLGSGVDNIGDYAFAGCTHLRSIVSKATYPPICSSIAFEGVPSYCTLTVPCGSLPYYSVQSPWDTQFPLKQEDCRTEYTLIVESADPTMGYVVGGGTALNGDTVVICAVGNPGYRFLRWQDNNTDSVRTVTVTGNATYTAYFSETVGIEDVEGYDQSGLRLYPNPAHSSVTVTGLEPGRRIALVDLYGRTLADLRASSTELTIDVSALSPGTYFVRVEGLPAQKVVVIK